MPATFPAPVKADLTTVLQDVLGATPANKVRTVSLRLINEGTDACMGHVYMTNGATQIECCKNLEVSPQGPDAAVDVDEKLVLPTGWKIEANASANGQLVLRVANIIETDVADFS